VKGRKKVASERKRMSGATAVSGSGAWRYKERPQWMSSAHHGRGRSLGVVQVGESVGEPDAEVQQGGGGGGGAAHAPPAIRGARAHVLMQAEDGADRGAAVERADQPHLGGA
jgi:hypothetical protein